MSREKVAVPPKIAVGQKVASLGDVLKLLREIKRLSQNGLALQLRTTPTAVALWESGLRNPNKWICKELGDMIGRFGSQLMRKYFYQLAGFAGTVHIVYPDEHVDVPAGPISPSQVVADYVASVTEEPEIRPIEEKKIDNAESADKIGGTHEEKANEGNVSGKIPHRTKSSGRQGKKR